MDKISGYFNDCFSDNYYIFKLTHKTNANIDEESKCIETTTTLLFDQVIREDASIITEDEEVKRDKEKGKELVSSFNQSSRSFSTHYITNAEIALQPGKLVKGTLFYALVDARNMIYVERKFADFVLLRRALNTLYPTCFIPILAGKDYYMMCGPDSVEDRQYHALKEFWNQLFPQTYLTSNDAFQSFIDFNCPITKTLNRCLKTSLDDLLSRYKLTFQNLKGLSLDENLYAKIEGFEEFVKEAQKKVKQLLNQIKVYQKYEAISRNEENTVYQSLRFLEQIILAGNYPECRSSSNSNLMNLLCEVPNSVFH